MSLLSKLLNIIDKIPLKQRKETARKKLLMNTFVDDIRDARKIDDLEDYNMEPLLPYYIMPTMMYTFMYLETDEELMNQKFTDMIPIIMCVESKPNYISGYNLNLMTETMKTRFFDALDRMFDSFYSEKVPAIWSEGKLAVNDKLFQLFSTLDGLKNFNYMMSKEIGCDISYCHKVYRINKIKNIHFLEYSDYPSIVSFDTSDSLKNFDKKAAFMLSKMKGV